MGRNEERLAALGAEIEAPFAAVDAADLTALEAAAGAAGPLNGIVNCAGSVLLKPAHLTTEAEWAETVRTNLTTAFCTVRAGARALPLTRPGLGGYIGSAFGFPRMPSRTNKDLEPQMPMDGDLRLNPLPATGALQRNKIGVAP